MSSFRPAIGGTLVITCDLWRPSTKGSNPSSMMIESNNGGSFVLDHLLDAKEGRTSTAPEFRRPRAHPSHGEAPEYKLVQPASGTGIATHCRGAMVVYRTRQSIRNPAE